MASDCAHGPDGQLLDASQIQFFFDVDDDNPLPAVPLSGTNTPAQFSSLGQSSPASELDLSLPADPLSLLMQNSGQKRAVLAAGSRRSGCATEPSKKPWAAATASKCAVEGPASSHTARCHRYAITDSHDETDTADLGSEHQGSDANK